MDLARVEAWLAELAPDDDPVRLRMQAHGETEGFPIIGPLVGRLVHLLARAINAKRIVEMGSGFGYSTAWFAAAVGPGGRVIHTDGSTELSEQAKGWLTDAGVVDRVRFRVGDARELIQDEADASADIVFIDIDKDGYPDAWREARRVVRVGGLIITDNTLWSGKVADTEADDDWTESVRDYDRLATTDPAFVTTILPLRDGVAVSLRVA